MKIIDGTVPTRYIVDIGTREVNENIKMASIYFPSMELDIGYICNQANVVFFSIYSNVTLNN